MSQAAGSQPAVDQGVSLPRYLVVHGRDGLALYGGWPQASLRVQGFPNAIYKKYRTGEDARDAYEHLRAVMATHGSNNVTPALMASLCPPPAYSSVSPGVAPFSSSAAGPPTATAAPPPAPAPASTPTPSTVPSAVAPAVATGPAAAHSSSDAPASTHNDLIAAMEPYDTLSDVGASDDEDTESLFALDTASMVSVPETEIDESETVQSDTDREQVLPAIAGPVAPANSAPAEVADAAHVINGVHYQATHVSCRPFPTVMPLLRAAVEASLTSDSVPGAAVRARYVQDMAKMLADVLFSGQAYYVIIRGREPGVTRTSWAGARHHVDGIADSYYQAFSTGVTARRWWKQHRGEVVDYGALGVASPLDNHDPNGPVPTAN